MFIFRMKRLGLAGALLALQLAAFGQSPAISTVRDVAYKGDARTLSDYESERCRLDLTLPAGAAGFATLVWFHGGGLKNGDKDAPGEYLGEIRASLAQAGVAVVTPSYRLSPKATYPAYVDDAAAAFAWTVRHIAAHGGNPRRVFIGGHSAGGYLALLVGFDASRLKPFGLPADAVAGIAQISGQIFTHYTVREERGQSRFAIAADEAAPSFHLSKSVPPVLTLYADKDMPSRAEENQFLVATLKAAGHRDTYEVRVKDRTHGSVGHNLRHLDDPARLAILEFMARQSARR